MRTNEFIREKLYLIMISFLTNIITILFLYAIQVNGQVILIISLLQWGMVLACLIIEYLRRSTYYHRLEQTLDGLDQKYLLTEIIDEPLFMDGKILYETLRIVDKSMADNVNRYRISQNEYKDYIIKELSLQECVSKVIRKHSKSFIYQKIKIQLDDLELSVYSDSKWLEFILDQIISNALKYTPKEVGTIHIWTTSTDNMISLHIQDNGSGISSSELGRIFEKGFTGTNGRLNEKATGMGLYLCKTLCNKLYLGIRAESVQGQGTTIILDFPISKLMLLK